MENNKQQKEQKTVSEKIQEQPIKKQTPKWFIPAIVVVGVIILGFAAYGAYSLIKSNITPSEDLTTKHECNNLWWYDNENTSCQEPKQFCDLYMYNGLETFEIKEECESSLAGKDWKTYRNEILGFEVKHPSHYEVLDIVSKYANFRDKKYGGLEWPGLTIESPPVAQFYGLEIPATESKVFKLENAKTENEVITVYFTNGKGKEIVAYCILYKNHEILEICNQILSTLEFIN